jgi:hypothetical protein
LNKTKTVLFGGLTISALMIFGVIASFPGDSNIQSFGNGQEQVDAALAQQGLVEIDGVWYSPEYLEFQETAKRMINEGKSVPLQIGGILTIEHFGENGNLISTQKIHNRVVDQGEDFLIDQAFKEGSAGETSDADQLASICVSNQVGFVDTSETKTAANFDTDNTLTSNNCIADASVTQSSQTAVIGALTFDAPTHVPAATTITGIGICQGSASTPFADCADAQAASSGILFSQINIADVTLQSSETVDITYTLDISSAGS